MGYSFKLKMYSKKLRKDGTGGIYFQLLIDRKKVELSINLSWPPNRFDENVGCKPRFKNDPLVNDYNIIINNARTKANKIFMDCRVKDKPITMEGFMREYYSKLSKVDFVQYFTAKSKERWGKRIITDSTYKHEKMVLGKVSSFKPSGILFRDFDKHWALAFDQHLKAEDLRMNSRWGIHKVVKTYLIMATKIDEIEFTNPYNYFKNVTEESDLQPLTKEELATFTRYYFGERIKEREITHKERVVLRRFIFACCTALRISDLKKLTIDNFISTDNFFTEGKMNLTPHKTSRYGVRVINKPLSDLALILLRDEIEEATDRRLFYRYNEVYSNSLLKDIALGIGINRRVYHHVGRSTFASLYDQAGGNHRSLMEYMGLKKMNTLMRYVKTNESVIAEAIAKMNSAMNETVGSKRVYMKTDTEIPAKESVTP